MMNVMLAVLLPLITVSILWFTTWAEHEVIEVRALEPDVVQEQTAQA